MIVIMMDVNHISERRKVAPGTTSVVVAAVQWAERIVRKIEVVFPK